MITVDCSEISVDEKLALATAISTRLEGQAIALVKGEEIVLDELTEEIVKPVSVLGIVRDFVSRRKDAEHYSTEIDGDLIVVHPADPIAAMKRKRQNQLPPNLLQCPFCGYITQYEVAYIAHTRLHYLSW